MLDWLSVMELEGVELLACGWKHVDTLLVREMRTRLSVSCLLPVIVPRGLVTVCVTVPSRQHRPTTHILNMNS